MPSKRSFYKKARNYGTFNHTFFSYDEKVGKFTYEIDRLENELKKFEAIYNDFVAKTKTQPGDKVDAHDAYNSMMDACLTLGDWNPDLGKKRFLDLFSYADSITGKTSIVLALLKYHHISIDPKQSHAAIESAHETQQALITAYKTKLESLIAQNKLLLAENKKALNELAPYSDYDGLSYLALDIEEANTQSPDMR